MCIKDVKSLVVSYLSIGFFGKIGLWTNLKQKTAYGLHTIWTDYHGDTTLVMDVTDKTGYGVFEDQGLIVRAV